MAESRGLVTTRAPTLGLLIALAPAPLAAQDLYSRAAQPEAHAASRLTLRARHLEFLASLPPRFLDLFGALTTRAERDSLRLQALRLAERAMQSTPDDPALLSVTATLYEHLGEHLRARELLDRALALDPLSSEAPDMLFTRALVRTRLGDHEGTRDDYLVALRFPLSAHARGTTLGNLAETYLSLNDTERAIEAFFGCVREAPDYALGWLGLAVAQDRQGEDPSEAAARAVRAAAARAAGRPDALLDELRREGVFFVPAYERYCFVAMAHEALAAESLRDAEPAARARAHRLAARVAWESWLAQAPLDHRWRAVAARHLARDTAREAR